MTTIMTTKTKKQPHRASAPEDTSRVDPLFHLAGMMEGGTSRYIEEQEREGQRQLVKSTSLPTQLIGCTEDEVRSLGIELGPVPTTGDSLFRPATLPGGWKLVPTSHSMWSQIIDDRGFVRAAMFYKAAFYDRAAHLNLHVRIHVRKDYDAEKRDGTTIVLVTADMPGQSPAGEQNVKVIHRHVDASDLSDKWKKADAADAAARAWLDEHYPDYKSVTAYWGTEF
jgi:hypothetical protein